MPMSLRLLHGRVQVGLIAAACMTVLSGNARTQNLPGTSAETPVIRATSRLVYVDVTVRDGSGRIVQELSESDFRVLEDKQPQTIRLFEAHSAPVATDSAGSKPASGPVEISNVPRGSRDTSLNMILLDLLNTSPQDQAYARKRMIDFLRAVPPGRQVALFTLTNGLHMIQNFTIDSAVLAKAAAAIEPSPLNRLRTPNQAVADRDLSAYIDFAASGGTWGQQNSSAISLGTKIQEELNREDIQNMKTRIDATNLAFTELARAVNGYAGRKNLFWLAGQFPSNSYYTLESLSDRSVTAATNSRNPGGELRSANRLASSSGLALGALSAQADRAIVDSQIAVYPISVVGVQDDFVGAEYNGIGSASTNTGDTAAAFFNERQNGREVMNHIADETGGEAFYGNNDPAALLRKGFDDGENFYTLAYQPTNHNWNGQLRRIHVALAGHGYSLSYRRSYVALPERATSNATAQFATAMRLEAPPASALVLRVVPPSAQKGLLQMDATINLQGVGLTVDPSGERRGRLQVRTVAYPVDRPAVAAELNSVMNVGLTPEDYTAVLGSGIKVRQTLHLPGGKFLVRLGVLDLTTGRVGTLTVPVTVDALAAATATP